MCTHTHTIELRWSSSPERERARACTHTRRSAIVKQASAAVIKKSGRPRSLYHLSHNTTRVVSHNTFLRNNTLPTAVFYDNCCVKNYTSRVLLSRSWTHLLRAWCGRLMMTMIRRSSDGYGVTRSPVAWPCDGDIREREKTRHGLTAEMCVSLPFFVHASEEFAV